MGKYKPPNDLPPEEGMTDGELKGFLDGTIDNVAVTMLQKAEARAIAKLGSAEGGDHTPGRYTKSATSWSGHTFAGESELLAGVKALAPSDVLERHASILAKTGLRGEALDGALTAEHWFRNDTLRQLTRHPKSLEGARAIDAFNQVNKATPLEGGADAQGGYTVPQIVSGEVLSLVRDASDVYSRARQIPMSSDTLLIPNEATAVTTFWSSTQGVALTGGEPVFGVTTLNAWKLAGRATFSLELLDDANVAIIPFLQSCFAEKMGGDLDSAAMEGTGVPFTGVAYAASVNDCSTNGTNGVTLQYGLGTSTIGGLIKTYIKGGEAITRRDSTWFCGPQVFGKIMAMVDTNGAPIVRLGSVAGEPSNVLFGRPLVVSNRMVPTTVGAGTVSVGNLYFGSPSALVFGVRQNMKWEVTDQVSWANYRADARMIGRFGFAVGVPAAWTRQFGIIV